MGSILHYFRYSNLLIKKKFTVGQGIVCLFLKAVSINIFFSTETYKDSYALDKKKCTFI